MRMVLKNWIWIALAMLGGVPWLIFRWAGWHESSVVIAFLTGTAILTAAFLLSWASEVVQLDISQALAVVILSLIAVLPEYSVDLYFAWRAGQDPAYTSYAVANMTGANRLLIGIGWSAVVLVYWWRTKKRRVDLAEHELLELSILAAVTIYAFVIVIKGTLSVFDSVVLIGMFGVYAYASYKQAPEEPDLVGPAAALGALPTRSRRMATIGLFFYAALVIVLSAEPFAESLIKTGHELKIDEFLLVQWVAPLASEAPEFIIAVLFVMRGHPHLALRTMVASKVNQWTLLVGMLAPAYALSAGRLIPLVLDGRQVLEVLLTAAQSLFAVALLSGLSLSVWGAAALATLFLVQFIFSQTHLLMSVVYVIAAVVILVLHRDRLRRLLLSPGKMLAAVTRAEDR